MSFLGELSIVKAFIALDTGGKIMVVALHLLGIAIVILYAKFTVKKQSVKTLQKIFSSKQTIEESIGTTSRCHKNNNMQNHTEKAAVRQHLLSKVFYPIKRICLYYSTDNKRNDQKQHLHIARTIPNGECAVNHNREEPKED